MQEARLSRSSLASTNLIHRDDSYQGVRVVTNFLHFKSINGADVGVFFYSVIESCKTNGLPPRAYINEMAHRVVNNEELESPYEYSKRLNDEIGSKLKSELERVSTGPGPP